MSAVQILSLNRVLVASIEIIIRIIKCLKYTGTDLTHGLTLKSVGGLRAL